MTTPADAELIHSKGLDLANRRIYLHGDAMVKDAEPGVDYRMANTFIKNLDILNAGHQAGDITVVLGTVGGDWNYGMAIYDAIKYSPNPVDVLVYGWARSMSSIIPQAARNRIMMPHADFMVHYGSTAYEGHYLTAKSGMKYEERSEKIMLDIYADRCQHGTFFANRTLPEISEYIDRQMKDRGDWWMSAQEAVFYGFADRVFTWAAEQ